MEILKLWLLTSLLLNGITWLIAIFIIIHYRGYKKIPHFLFNKNSAVLQIFGIYAAASILFGPFALPGYIKIITNTQAYFKLFGRQVFNELYGSGKIVKILIEDMGKAVLVKFDGYPDLIRTNINSLTLLNNENY